LRAQRVKWLKKEAIPSISSQASTIRLRLKIKKTTKISWFVISPI
jgi:hypothetical protein